MRDTVPPKLHQFNTAAIAPLLDALQDEDEELRYGVIWAVGRVHNSILGAELSPAAFEACLDRLENDPSARVRLSALNSLAQMHRQVDQGPLVKTFIAALGDEQEQIRAEAARWLGQFGDAKAVKSLIALLSKDESEFVRGRAAYALAFIEEDLASLSKAGDDATHALLTALSDPERLVRLRAIWALGQLKANTAIRSLSNILDSEGEDNYLEKRKAAEALGAIGDKSAVESLVTALQTQPHEGVRTSAAEALGVIKDKRIIDVLIHSLTTDLEANVRASAAKALHALGDRTSREALLAALEDESPEVRFRAVQALAVIGTKTTAVEPLTVIRDDPQSSRALRMAAEQALTAFT
jgi:HEAT repeat protein